MLLPSSQDLTAGNVLLWELSDDPTRLDLDHVTDALDHGFGVNWEQLQELCSRSHALSDPEKFARLLSVWPSALQVSVPLIRVHHRLPLGLVVRDHRIYEAYAFTTVCCRRHDMFAGHRQELYFDKYNNPRACRRVRSAIMRLLSVGSSDFAPNYLGLQADLPT